MKKLLPLLALLLAAPAFAQLTPIYCVTATSVMCNTTSNPGNHSQGDAAWLAFGKLNSWGTQLGLFSNQPANEVAATPSGATGILSVRALVGADIPPINLAGGNANGGITGVLPIADGGTGLSSVTANDCLAGNSGGTALTYVTCGSGGGSPGGSSGQLQYNNAGAFGGFTLAGDCTFSEPNITCTKTNGTAFTALATTVPGTGVGTALGVNVGTAGAFVVEGGAGGTPSSINLANATFPASISAITTLAGLTSANGSTVPASAGTLLGTGATASMASGFALNYGSGDINANQILGNTVPTLATGYLNWTGSAWTFSTPAASLPSCSLSDLIYYASTGTTGTCLTLGTNLSITSGTLNASSTASTAFSALTGSTNTTAAMLVGAGASLGYTSTGVVNANQVNSASIPASASCVSTNASSQFAANCPQAINPQTGTTYTVVSGDYGKLITFNNAGAIAVTLPQATGSFTTGFYIYVQNLGAGAVTITPTTSTINGAATLVVNQNFGCKIVSDGTNYQVSDCTAVPVGVPVQVNGTNVSTASALNFENSAAFNGLTFTFSNPSAANIQLGATGSLALTGLATQAADSLVGNATGSTAAPTAVTVNATELAVLQDTTAIAVSGCTPSASSLAPTSGGTITQPATACTTATFTFAVTAPHGWNCTMGDITQTNAGTYIPPWVESSNTTTTCVVKIPAAAQVASDVLSLQASWY